MDRWIELLEGYESLDHLDFQGQNPAEVTKNTTYDYSVVCRHKDMIFSGLDRSPRYLSIEI